MLSGRICPSMGHTGASATLSHGWPGCSCSSSSPSSRPMHCGACSPRAAPHMGRDYISRGTPTLSSSSSSSSCCAAAAAVPGSPRVGLGWQRGAPDPRLAPARSADARRPPGTGCGGCGCRRGGDVPGGVPGIPAVFFPPGAGDVCQVVYCFPPPLFQGEQVPRPLQHPPLPSAPRTAAPVPWC